MRYVVTFRDDAIARIGRTLSEARDIAYGNGTIYELGPEVKEPDYSVLANALQQIKNLGGCDCLPERTCPQHIADAALKTAGIE